MKKFAYSFAGLILAATAAHAQPAPDAADQNQGPEAPDAVAAQPATPAEPATPADPGADAAAEPATPADPASPADSAAGTAAVAAAGVTEAEIDSFAQATVKLQAIQADTTIADDQKRSAMVAAVTEAGLDPVKYNEIGKAAAADPQLRATIQTAMARHTSDPDG